MSIGKIQNLNSSSVDPILDYLKSNPTLVKKIDENKVSGVGTIQLTQSLPQVLQNKNTYKYSNFDVLTHYEWKEIDPKKASDYKITKTNLEYNFLLRNYEKYLNENSNIQEINLPYFYYILSELITDPSFKSFKGESFFDKDPATLVPNNVTNASLKVIPFESTVKFPNQNESYSLSEYFNTFSPFKEQFPFYTQVRIDSLPANDLVPLMDKISAFKYIFELFTKTPTGIMDLKKVLSSYILQARNNVDINSFLSSINKLAAKHYVNYESVLNNQLCFSEPIAYKITKHQDFGPNPDAIQTWYLPNVFKDTLEFIDSQVKYNKQYRYKVAALYAVFDTNYEYTKFDILTNSISYKNVNSLTLYEVADTIYENKILDKPPLEPEIEFIPFLKTTDYVKINLNTSIGRKKVLPTWFSSEEKVMVDSLLASQDEAKYLTFESDEPCDFFEIYRLEEEPKQYEDFFRGNKNKISTQQSSAASVIDYIHKNKKYYYTFRSIDFHNHFSNPSTMYEVEIMEDNGLILPIIKNYEFKKENDIQIIKPFKRYLSIKPSLGQTILKSYINNQAVVGINSNPLWDKNIKIRLTSKSSGKKIDLNLTFTVKPEDN